MKLLLALCAVVLAVSAAKLPHELTGQELVDYINQQGKWTAKLHDRFLGKSEDQLRSALGAHIRPNEAVAENAVPLPASNSALREPELPKNFNAADAWPKCSALIRQIADQSTCGSCWAVSTSGAMQDRMCIASDGQLQEGLSALDVLSCCKNCGYQCQGGYPDKAFDFMRQSGLVSGSNFTAAQGCKPYPLKPCHLEAHAKRPVCPPAPEHPYECHQECQDSFKSFTYNQDKHFAGNYHLFSRKPNEAMRNLMEHGSLTASFMVYEDFFHYEGGVYEYVAGRQLGGHAVRVVGWGEDEQTGTPYWLVANSWHDYWGEKGYFRIKRGTNEVQFEHQMLGALADVTRTLEQRKH